MSIADKALIISTNNTEIDENMSKVYGAGFDNGNLAGKELGEAIGYEKGYTEGYTKGNTDGYDKGLAEGIQTGHENGYAEGHEVGKQSERQALWGVFQNNGGEMNYEYAFAFNRFTDETYNPPHSIVCSNVTTGGAFIYYNNGYITDTKVPIYVCNSATSMFRNSAVVTIRKLVVTDKVTYNTTFTGCYDLENIIIEGTIAYNINFGDCAKLTKASITSAMNALSSITSGKSITFSEKAIKNAFGDSTSEEWIALRESKPNWTISFIE